MRTLKIPSPIRMSKSHQVDPQEKEEKEKLRILAPCHGQAQTKSIRIS